MLGLRRSDARLSSPVAPSSALALMQGLAGFLTLTQQDVIFGQSRSRESLTLPLDYNLTLA